MGVSGERLVLLHRREVRFAEADGSDVWLDTDEGRLQASVHGIDKLEDELAGSEFLRVHRRFLVNLSCVRAIDRGERGELLLVIDSSDARGRARVPPQRARRAARPGNLGALRDRRALHRAVDELVGLRLLAGRDDGLVVR